MVSVASQDRHVSDPRSVEVLGRTTPCVAFYRRVEPYVQEFVRLKADGDVRPAAFSITWITVSSVTV